MKKYLKSCLKKQGYETPKAEVIVMEMQGVLCSSASDGSRGGTESMNLTDVNWP
jgi:hypothetical protein